MVAGGCIIVMEIVYKMDFSLPGFLICSIILGFGMSNKTVLFLSAMPFFPLYSRFSCYKLENVSNSQKLKFSLTIPF